jgi:hypothetical protein
MSNSPAPNFKKLSRANWAEPDPVMRHFVGVSQAVGNVKPLSGDDWANYFLAVQLADAVPDDVLELFDVAKGVCLYGWFFYPLYHLAEEQLFRVADTAVAAKCKKMRGPDQGTSFNKRLDWLKARNVLTAEERRWWDSIRELRNLGSHPDFQSVHPPGSVLAMFRDVAKGINALWPSEDSPPSRPEAAGLVGQK